MIIAADERSAPGPVLMHQRSLLARTETTNLLVKLLARQGIKCGACRAMLAETGQLLDAAHDKLIVRKPIASPGLPCRRRQVAALRPLNAHARHPPIPQPKERRGDAKFILATMAGKAEKELVSYFLVLPAGGSPLVNSPR